MINRYICETAMSNRMEPILQFISNVDFFSTLKANLNLSFELLLYIAHWISTKEKII